MNWPQSNILLEQLNTEDRAAVMTLATPTQFALGDTLCAPGDLLTHLHFVDKGIISVVAELSDGRSVEAFMVGYEGVSGLSASTVPARSFSRHVVQVAGSSLRVDADRFRLLAAERPAMRRRLAQYGAEVVGELEQSTACNALHGAVQRLAKWLLRCHDRVEGDVILLTQEYLASMLGSQRTTVNEAAQALQAAGALSYSRGKLVVLSRTALEGAACECYRAQPSRRRDAARAT
jgi:CRP-like cAMP-binding protein